MAGRCAEAAVSSLSLIILNIKPTASLGKLDFARFVAGFYLKAFICFKLWQYFAPQPWRSRVTVAPARRC